MKLNYESLKHPENWAGYHLPTFDPAEIAQNTKAKPQWLHFGAGNIFRIFPAVLCQRLIEAGEMDTGVICCEGYDDEIITKCFRPYDNLSVAVTLCADGSIEKEVVGSMVESLTMLHDGARVREIFETPSLQMVSFTITEKGYALRNPAGELYPVVAADMENGPEGCRHFMSQLAALCVARFHACGAPLALVSMDNCSHNGEKLQSAILDIAKAWAKNGKISADALAYLTEQVSFPWSMIDKITPRPNASVEAQLIADGLEGISPFVTTKNTYTAAFVNAEKPQYLVVEDLFPNGRPPLEKAGVYLTDRDTVNCTERMKVTTCLNPLHTALAVYGCLLGYTSIAAEMQDAELKGLVERIGYDEGMPVVTDPGILSPAKFIDEVIGQRFPNPFIPDTPQRIATDTSQKIPIRFGETIKSYIASETLNVTDLTFIPLAIAGWLRYLLGVDDQGEAMEVSADPMLAALQEQLSGIELGKPETVEGKLGGILSNPAVFASDLVKAGLATKIEGMVKELVAGPGAVRATLQKYLAK